MYIQVIVAYLFLNKLIDPYKMSIMLLLFLGEHDNNKTLQTMTFVLSHTVVVCHYVGSHRKENSKLIINANTHLLLP